MNLSDRIGFDFSKLDLSIMTSDAMTTEHRETMIKVMSEKLSHRDIITTLSNPDVKCHVDSYFRPVSQKEAAIRVSRGGMEYCMIPMPVSGQHILNMRRVRALALTGALMEFIESTLRSQGIDCMIEARTDFNRFHALSALYPDGRIVLFVDISPIYPRARNDAELSSMLMSVIDDMPAVSIWMALFHLARHAIQLHQFHVDKNLDEIRFGMKARFLAGCDDPAYYMASYPENLMCLEAEFESFLDVTDLLAKISKQSVAEKLVLDALNYKMGWHNTENLIFPSAKGCLPDYGYALVGLTTKMFKTAEWYKTEPEHDRAMQLDDQIANGWDKPGGIK